MTCSSVAMVLPPKKGTKEPSTSMASSSKATIQSIKILRITVPRNQAIGILWGVSGLVVAGGASLERRLSTVCQAEYGNHAMLCVHHNMHERIMILVLIILVVVSLPLLVLLVRPTTIFPADRVKDVTESPKPRKPEPKIAVATKQKFKKPQNKSKQDANRQWRDKCERIAKERMEIQLKAEEDAAKALQQAQREMAYDEAFVSAMAAAENGRDEVVGDWIEPKRKTKKRTAKKERIDSAVEASAVSDAGVEENKSEVATDLSKETVTAGENVESAVEASVASNTDVEDAESEVVVDQSLNEKKYKSTVEASAASNAGVKATDSEVVTDQPLEGEKLESAVKNFAEPDSDANETESEAVTDQSLEENETDTDKVEEDSVDAPGELSHPVTETAVIPQTHPLFALPAELRNIIYEEVLCTDSLIPVGHGMIFNEPGLLQLNKQTREEGSKMFYLENEFRFHIRDFDCTLLRRWVRSNKLRRDASMYIVVNPSNHWSNLKIWLRHAYLDRRLAIGAPMEPSTPRTEYMYAMCQFFRVVLRESHAGASWESVERHLEDLRYAMAILKPGYMAG